MSTSPAPRPLLIRPIGADEVERVVQFPSDPALHAVDADALRAEFAQGRMRPEWSWILERDGHLQALALWWGRTDSTSPLALDALDVAEGLDEPERLAAELLAAGLAATRAGPDARLPEYTMRLPQNWRADDDVAAAVRWREEAARRVGLTQSVERWQYAWRPDDGLPADVPSLTFRPGTDAEFVALFAEATKGSLDVETVRGLRSRRAEAQARDDFEFYLGCPGDRDWWQVAVAADGTPVGFAVPSATPYNRNVGYLGVLPAHRGLGLVDALLREITRIHADAGATLVTATTDATNAPMIAAFARAHYQVTEVRLVLEADVAT